MKKPDSGNQAGVNRRLQDRIGLHAARGHYRRALDILDQFIEDPLPLFQSQQWVIEEHRLAWLYRIKLLREWGRLTEALAWACLEVEMNPTNVAAIALRERLKREAGLLPRHDANRQHRLSDPKASLALWKGVAGMRDLKAMLERDVILPLQEPEIYRQYRLTLPNGILLYGPPAAARPTSPGSWPQ